MNDLSGAPKLERLMLKAPAELSNSRTEHPESSAKANPISKLQDLEGLIQCGYWRELLFWAGFYD